VLIAWPQFLLHGEWVSVSELFGDLDELGSAQRGFTNSDAETLFDAVAHTAIDWDGRTTLSCSGSACDLSSFVAADLGTFSSRDELFDKHGETLCLPARIALEPFLRTCPASI
jgi:hypothetical protein